MMTQATCKFCALSDDTIQVICESRCLICSRCQQIPILRKLLIDHTMAIDVSSTATQPARTYLKGFCPVCESSMSTTMLTLISTYKELYKTTDDIFSGRPNAGLEMEETTNLLSSFLKRHKATHETDIRKVKDAATQPDRRIMPCPAEIYDISTLTPHNINLATPMMVLEFIVDCYTNMWQNMLRNGKDSMIVTAFKSFNRKRFSQRTNDLRTRSVLDFLAATTGSETPDFLLFARLIGLQPKQTASPRPAWGFIATCVMAAGFCDRCIKTGQIYDLGGNPNVAEFRQKVSRLAGTGNEKTFQPKSISLRKAIKIIELLTQSKQPYWVMAPIIPQCVEYASKLPWDRTSLSKLLNVLIFMCLHEDTKGSQSVLGTRSNTASGSRNSVSLPSLGPHGGGNRATSVSFSLAPEQSAASLAAAIMQASAHHGSPASTPGPSAGARRRGSSADMSESMLFGSSKVVLLRNLDTLITKVWRANPNKVVTTQGRENKMFFLSSLDKHKFPTYIPMDFDQALALAESNHSILLSELAYICVFCWDVEYATIHRMLERGQTTFSRRPAIVGFYDTNKAKMTAVERMCLVRLLHWYSTEEEFLGIDWDDVEMNAKERLFPFAIPASVLEKSHNELNHLASVLVQELKDQKLKDAAEDAALAESGAIAAAHRKLDRARAEVEELKREEEEMYTLEQIEQFNREQYLASHTLGYVDNFLLHNQDAMEGVHPPVSRMSSAHTVDSDSYSYKSSRPSSSSRKMQHSMSMSDAFITDPAQEQEKLLETLNHARSCAGLPTTADLAATEGAGAFSAFATTIHTADSVERQLVHSRPGTAGDRTLGGLARPLTPHGGGHLLVVKPATTVPPTPATAKKNTPPPVLDTDLSPRLNTQQKLAQENFVSRNLPTPLESDVARMKISDPKTFITGHGVTSTAVRSRHGVGGGGGGQSQVDAMDSEDGFNMLSSLQRQSSQAFFPSRMPSRLPSRRTLTALVEPSVEAKKDPEAQYQAALEASKQSRLQAAQNRVQERIDLKERLEKEKEAAKAAETGQNATADSSGTKIQFGANTTHPNKLPKKPTLTRINSQKRQVNLRVLPVLNFNQYIGEYGAVTIDLATHLSAESAVQVFSLRDRSISVPTFQNIVDHYFKPWHFDHLVRIDIININIGPNGARMLSEKFAKAAVQLVHLNLTGCQIGGQGLRLILKALVDGESTENLLRLDLQNNNISLASDSFSYIGHFTNLRALDVSRNCFTLDTAAQAKIFRAGLTPLTSLQILSVAHNKIMDKGCKFVCDIVRENYPDLRILDFAGCFLSKGCLPVFEELLNHVKTDEPEVDPSRRPSMDDEEEYSFLPELVIELESTTNPELREILLQENVFTASQFNDYCGDRPNSVMNQSKCKLNINTSKYIGVAFPLCYDLADFGIENYVV